MTLLIFKKVLAFVVFASVGTTAITLPLLDWNVQETQDSKSNYVYFYARGNAVAPKPFSENIDHDNKNFLCKFKTETPFDCEISTVKNNFQKQHKIGKIISSQNKPSKKDLINPNNIFQIKFDASLWSFVQEDKYRFIDIIHKPIDKKSTQAYAYLEPLFATYKNETKGFFNAVIGEVSNIGSTIVNSDDSKYFDYSYSFENKETPTGEEIICQVQTSITKKYDDSKTHSSWELPWKFHFKTSRTWWEKEHYVIFLAEKNGITNFKQENIYLFQNYTKGKVTMNISEPIFYDHYSDHIFIFDL